AALNVRTRVGCAGVQTADAGSGVGTAGGGASARGEVLALDLVAARLRHAACDVGVRRRDVGARVRGAHRADRLHDAAGRDARGRASVLALDLVTRRVRQAADSVFRRRRKVAARVGRAVARAAVQTAEQGALFHGPILAGVAVVGRDAALHVGVGGRRSSLARIGSAGARLDDAAARGRALRLGAILALGPRVVRNAAHRVGARRRRRTAGIGQTGARGYDGSARRVALGLRSVFTLG